MKLTICEDRGETRRRTGNRSWPTPPQGALSGRIAGRALELKALIQRDMDYRSIEAANALCEALIRDAQAVEHVMRAPLTGGYHG